MKMRKQVPSQTQISLVGLPAWEDGKTRRQAASTDDAGRLRPIYLTGPKPNLSV